MMEGYTGKDINFLIICRHRTYAEVQQIDWKDLFNKYTVKQDKPELGRIRIWKGE